MCSGSEAGSYLRLIDSCITQLKAQGPSRTCNESKEEKKKTECGVVMTGARGVHVRDAATRVRPCALYPGVVGYMGYSGTGVQGNLAHPTHFRCYLGDKAPHTLSG